MTIPNGWELLMLITIGLVILGPQRLPTYAAHLGRLVRRARALTDDATTHLRSELGPQLDEVEWRRYDPRQYDPRRIVREALLEPSTATEAPNHEVPAAGGEE